MSGYSNIVSGLNNTANGYTSSVSMFVGGIFLNPDAATRIVITEKYRKPKLIYSSNIAIGRHALMTITSGNNNTAIGYQSLATGTNSSYSSILGNGRR